MLSRFKLVGLLFLIIPEKILLNSGVHNNKEKNYIELWCSQYQGKFYIGKFKFSVVIL